VRTGGITFQQISEKLEELRKLRERADYEISDGEIEFDRARAVIRTARWLIRNRIKALPEAEFRRLHVPRG
jgi:uncharacterized protein (UPF0332 family)